MLTENWETGLRQFSQLLHNKKFVLVFIRTLEAQNTFQMKDRLVIKLIGIKGTQRPYDAILPLLE